MKAKKTYLLFFICFWHFAVLAQTKEITNQSLYWMRYYSQLTMNEKWTWHNEFDNRRFFEKNEQHHFIAHTRLHYKIAENIDIALGLTYSLQSPQDPNATSNLVVPEIRPVQEFNYSIPVSQKFTIQQRLRIDERFIRKNDSKQLFDGYNFNFRFRYRVQASYKLHSESSNLSTTLKVSNELMINAGKKIINNHFDQNRVYVGIEQDVTKNFAIELGYLHWYQQRASGYQFFDREILRFTIYHKISLKKKE
jgi:DNA segregation ATPase FtsK/SpoIIIE-like protein